MAQFSSPFVAYRTGAFLLRGENALTPSVWMHLHDTLPQDSPLRTLRMLDENAEHVTRSVQKLSVKAFTDLLEPKNDKNDATQLAPDDAKECLAYIRKTVHNRKRKAFDEAILEAEAKATAKEEANQARGARRAALRAKVVSRPVKTQWSV